MESGVGSLSSNRLLEKSQEQGDLLQPLLRDLHRTNEVPKKVTSRIWHTRSAPPLDVPDATQKPRVKDLAGRARKSLPPPPQFLQEGGGSSTLLKALIGLVVYLLAGIVSFSMLQDELEGSSTVTLVDAMYFAIVTMTTVGYGDLVPKTVGMKLFTCAFVFIGFGLVGALVNGAANYLVEKQEKILVQKIYHKYKKKGKKDLEFEVADDNDVVAAHWKAAVSGVTFGILFIAGVLVLIYCEEMSFIDAFYCVCVTVTTLGYGDHSFQTKNGRLFAVVWILSSTVCVAQFFLYLAESRTEERQHELASWALNRPTTTSDLEAADLDGDGVVSAAEFVIYKLKEVGKIEEDDVLEILREFAALDIDESGTLQPMDIHVSNLQKQKPGGR